jgi:hypothetical protein
MGFLARLFRATPREEIQGASLGQDAAWEVSPTSDLAAFLRALPLLLLPDSILYIEGASLPDEVKAFLDTRRVPEALHIAVGTLWPRPKVFHLPATAENLATLTQLAETCAPFEIAFHLHAYCEGKVLLQWYDAFTDPLYLSADIAEEAVEDFCAALSVTYMRLSSTTLPTQAPEP